MQSGGRIKRGQDDEGRIMGNRKHLRLYLLPFSATRGANADGSGRRRWQRTSGRAPTRPHCDATPRPISFRRPTSPTDRGKRYSWATQNSLSLPSAPHRAHARRRRCEADGATDRERFSALAGAASAKAGSRCRPAGTGTCPLTRYVTREAEPQTTGPQTTRPRDQRAEVGRQRSEVGGRKPSR